MFLPVLLVLFKNLAMNDEVRDLVMKGYETARQIIAKNRSAVRAMAEELLLVESLDAEGIKTVIRNAA